VTSLADLSAVAARSFSSKEEAFATVLSFLHRTLGLRTPFLARTNHGRFEVIAVEDRGGCPVRLGDTLPLEDSY
jgi:hypothetical protein